MKKTISLLMVSIMTVLLIAGCSSEQAKQEPKGGENGSQSGTVQKIDKKFTMLTSSNPTFPYKKEWPIWKWIEEKTGITFDVTLPSGTLNDTISLTMASGNLPDLIFMSSTLANKYGEQGALANILDYVDSMPNFKKWIESYPEMAKRAISADGKMYIFPNQGFGETNRNIWMYRKDIFDKHGLKAPSDYDELYTVMKKLKELYPDAYPFAFDRGQTLDILINMSANFQTFNDMYYDFEKKEWKYGPIEDSYKTLIEYMNRFYKEGLIPPDWMTMQTKQWQDLISTNKAFITADYIGRIDLFNPSMRKDNPQFNLDFMAPPAGTPGGKRQNPNLQAVDDGLTVASTSKNIKDVMKYMDFFYSEEARERSSWGKEGETFTIENGKKKFVPGFTSVPDMRAKTGMATNGTYTWIDYDAHISLFSTQLQSAYTEARKYDMRLQPRPAFNAKENEVLSLTGEAIKKHLQENVAKFVMGDRSLSEWDKFVTEIKGLGLQKMADVYKEAYQRGEEVQLK